MTTIGELDFSASFDADGVESLQSLLEDIHEANSVSESYDDVEARGVEGHAVRLVIELLTDLQGGWIGVVPDSDCFIDGASGDHVLLDADVHALDGSGVEGADEIVVLGVLSRSLQVNVDLHNLVVLRREDNAVVGAGQRHALDPRGHYSLLEFGVFLLIVLDCVGQFGSSIVGVLWVL